MLRSPEAFAAADPALVGFDARDSSASVFLHQGRVIVAMRLDLSETLEEAAECVTATGIQADEGHGLVLRGPWTGSPAGSSNMPSPIGRPLTSRSQHSASPGRTSGCGSSATSWEPEPLTREDLRHAIGHWTEHTDNRRRRQRGLDRPTAQSS